MKKIYLLTGALVSGVAAFAQYAPLSLPAQKNALSVAMKPNKQTGFEKAEGDTLWSSDFSVAGQWTISNAGAPNHTGGDWAIVNALPASLVSQAANYGFPTAMNSTSGGNFALVNSDAAGANAQQDAWLTSGNIDLSALATGTPIYLRYKEIYRHFQESYYIQVSNDGGATWTEFNVNPLDQVSVNSNSGNPDLEVLNITPAVAADGGEWSNEVRIRFRYVGTYDWFWGVDDVQLVEAFENDIKINSWYQAAGVQTAETIALDYYMVNTTQANFPGFTFGAFVNNNGGATQNDVALNVSSGSFDETGPAVTLTSGQTDSIYVDELFELPMAVGDYTIDLTATMGATDADMENNERSLTVRRDAYWYARDNGEATGGIANVTSQDGQPLKIGNFMEIYDDMDISMIQVRLLNQATAVGQEIFGEIYVWDEGAGDFVFYGETDPHEVVTDDLANFVALPLTQEVSVEAGALILVVACHNGGTDEVGFAYAQQTVEGTVQGFAAGGDRFTLTSPNAIMIRVSDQGLSLNENEADFNVNIFPNPAVNEAKIAYELTNTSDVVVTVTDLAGKVVYTNALGTTAAGKHAIELNTAAFANGVYAVNFSANNAIVTKKLIVRK